jgi:hypothetical protein
MKAKEVSNRIMSQEKSEHVSAAKTAARGVIAAAVIAAFTTIIVAIINKSQNVDATPPNPSYSANQNNSNAGAVVSDAGSANRNPQQNPNANRHPESGQTNNNSPSSIIPNIPHPPKETPTPVEEYAIATKDSEGFTVELRSCRASGSDIVVSLMITNHKEDRKLWLFDDTAITDYDGEIHKVDDKRFGGSEIDTKAKTEVPVRATLTFRGIAKTVKNVKLLDLHFQHFRESTHNFNVLFEKFAVSN